MQRIVFLLIPLTGLFLFFTCEKTEVAENEVDLKLDLTGEWQLYERGYSPGSGYVVESVEPGTSKSIAFRSGNQFSSNIEGLESFNYYYLLEDHQEGEEILALFTHKQNPKEINFSNVSHSYNVVKEEGSIKLHYRFCIEGCHLGFKKIKGDSNF